MEKKRDVKGKLLGVALGTVLGVGGTSAFNLETETPQTHKIQLGDQTIWVDEKGNQHTHDPEQPMCCENAKRRWAVIHYTNGPG